MRSLVLHGLGGSGPEHWQTWLVGELEKAGHEVAYPQLPRRDDPLPDEWREAALVELDAGPEVVVCHSLACLLWLDLAARAEGGLTERVLLVAPPDRPDMPEVARFLDHGAGAAAVSRAARVTHLVCSDNDPYCPAGAVERYAKPLGIGFTLIEGAEHINTDSGHGPWPWVLRWVAG